MSIAFRKLEFIVYLPDDAIGESGVTQHQFKIAIQDSEQFPDLQSKFIELTPKFEADITVCMYLYGRFTSVRASYPLQVTPRVLSADLSNMTAHERKCLYRSEKDILHLADDFLVFERDGVMYSQRKSIDILNYFSSTGCQYECMLQYAFHMCKCVPWNHPQFQTTHQEIQHLRHLYHRTIEQSDCHITLPLTICHRR